MINHCQILHSVSTCTITHIFSLCFGYLFRLLRFCWFWFEGEGNVCDMVVMAVVDAAIESSSKAVMVGMPQFARF